jgi:predicted nucleic acid-binding protein
MNKIFLDTNIVLDLLGEREPFYKPTAKLFTLADKHLIKLFVSGLSFVNIHYILSKSYGTINTQIKLRQLKALVEVVALDDFIISQSLNTTMQDFEDATQYFCALQADCSVLLTRNAKDFRNSQIPIMNVDEYLQTIKNLGLDT